MIRLAFPLVFLALAACGVDGKPTPPEPRVQKGLTISGTAEIGLVGQL